MYAHVPLLVPVVVMIKGIARRLGVEWGLCRKWAVYAREALLTDNPAEALPIWRYITPRV